MKKKQHSNQTNEEEIPPLHDLDYRQAKPNRFANKLKNGGPVVVLLDPDVAKVFRTPESVNNILRALITNLPDAQLSKVDRQ